MKKTITEDRVQTSPKKTNEKKTVKTIDSIKEIFVFSSTKSALKFRFLGLVFIFLGYLFFQALNVFYMILTAIIISISMEGVIYSLEKRIKQREIAIAIGYFLLIIFIVSGIILIVPFIISQITYLIDWISGIIGNLKIFITGNSRPDAILKITRLPEFIQEYLISHRAQLNSNGNEIQTTILSNLNTLLDTSVGHLTQFSSGVFSVIGSLFSVIGELVIIFTLAVFFSIEKDYLTKLVTKCFSKTRRAYVYEKIDFIYSQLSARLKARVILSCIVALMFLICLWIINICGIDIPNIFTLSVITGLLDIIPYIGPCIAAIPIVLLAYIHNGFWAMMLVGFLFVFIQWLENYVVIPFLMGKQLGVNPVLIFICALLGGVILGFWGVILSVPFAVILSLFIDSNKNETSGKSD